MICAWKELLSVLPPDIRQDVDQNGYQELQEIRLRFHLPAELVLVSHNRWLTRIITPEDLSFVINAASRFSPWAAETISRGFLTAPGGHRIGVCGEAVCKNGKMDGIRQVTSVCIRVAKDYSQIVDLSHIHGSVLILGAPGWGKTTLLRDLIRQLSENSMVCVVDERKELFPQTFQTGKQTDILSGCSKAEGLTCLLRAMRPDYLAVDEITEEQDCLAMIQAANCGVRLAATAHASSWKDYLGRSIYRPLISENIFQTILILNKDKSYTVERMGI